MAAMKPSSARSGTAATLALVLMGCGSPVLLAQPATQPATQPTTQPDDGFDVDDEPQHEGGFFGIEVPRPGDPRPPHCDEQSAHDASADPLGVNDPADRTAMPEIDPAAWAVLTRLEAEGDALDTLTARLTYDKVQGIFGQEQRRFGDLWYQADQPNPRFAVRFDGLRLGGHGKPLATLNEWYIFDGRWLLERDDRKKNATRRELAAPGEAIDLLSTDGLPLPLQIDAVEITERFEVTLKRNDKRATVLELIPKQRDPERGAQSVELMFLPDAELDRLTPRRVLIKEANGDQTSVTLSSVGRNGAVDPEVFDTRPDPQAMRGWDVQVLPLEPAAAE